MTDEPTEGALVTEADETKANDRLAPMIDHRT